MSIINKAIKFFKKSKRPRILPIGGMNRRIQQQVQQARSASPGNAFSSQMKGEFDQVKDLAKEKQISERCAFYVFYLRDRRDWSKEAENELIRIDRAGENLPNIYTWKFTKGNKDD